MLRKSVVVLVILLSGLSFGQTEITTLISEVTIPDSQGTFQIVLADEKMIEPAITADLLNQIEDERNQTETIMWEYSPYITIKILSRELMLSGNYQPLNTFGYVK
ncbi:MAG: hypothetical protein ACI865_002356 [Flavobacteriaceae bacterium]|jgi:hypothetical protein